MTISAQEIKALLDSALPGCEIQVVGEGGKYRVMATGDVFAGLSAVKRQQKVYAVLNDHISSGAIHAVSMQLLGNDEAGSAN